VGARILFVTWDGGGNVPPVLALAARLTGRGHEVAVLGSASLAERVEAEGLPFTGRPPAQEWDATAQALDVAGAVRASGADLIVVDYMLPGALCGAVHAGAPVAALVHTLYAANLRDGDLLPMAMAASVEGVNATRTQLGLPAVGRLGDLLDEVDAVLVTSPEGLDLPVPPSRARTVRYVGPVLQVSGPDAGWRPPGGDGDGPLVVVSLGTTPMDEGPVLQRVLDGLADQPVRVVATVGEHLYPSDFTVPANAVVLDHVRHAAVLPWASAVVTHAGLGTVLAALAHGVPLLCLPLGREQPVNAAAVERVGAGVCLDPQAAPAEIAAAVDRLLHDPEPRLAAQRLAALIEVQRDAALAEAEIERLLGA
jgi:UDP:flavonoid glycosyltransferase YjiC (YdhE family)